MASGQGAYFGGLVPSTFVVHPTITTGIGHGWKTYSEQMARLVQERFHWRLWLNWMGHQGWHQVGLVGWFSKTAGGKAWFKSWTYHQYWWLHFSFLGLLQKDFCTGFLSNSIVLVNWTGYGLPALKSFGCSSCQVLVVSAQMSSHSSARIDFSVSLLLMVSWFEKLFSLILFIEISINHLW